MHVINMPKVEVALLDYWRALCKAKRLDGVSIVTTMHWSSETGPTLVIETTKENLDRVRTMPTFRPYRKVYGAITTVHGTVLLRVPTPLPNN